MLPLRSERPAGSLGLVENIEKRRLVLAISHPGGAKKWPMLFSLSLVPVDLDACRRSLHYHPAI